MLASLTGSLLGSWLHSLWRKSDPHDLVRALFWLKWWEGGALIRREKSTDGACSRLLAEEEGRGVGWRMALILEGPAYALRLTSLLMNLIMQSLRFREVPLFLLLTLLELSSLAQRSRLRGQLLAMRGCLPEGVEVEALVFISAEDACGVCSVVAFH